MVSHEEPWIIICMISMSLGTLFVSGIVVPFTYWVGKHFFPMDYEIVVVAYALCGLVAGAYAFALEKTFDFGVVFWKTGYPTSLNPDPIPIVSWFIFVYTFSFLAYAVRKYPEYEVWAKEHFPDEASDEAVSEQVILGETDG